MHRHRLHLREHCCRGATWVSQAENSTLTQSGCFKRGWGGVEARSLELGNSGNKAGYRVGNWLRMAGVGIQGRQARCQGPRWGRGRQEVIRGLLWSQGCEGGKSWTVWAQEEPGLFGLREDMVVLEWWKRMQQKLTFSEKSSVWREACFLENRVQELPWKAKGTCRGVCGQMVPEPCS